MKKKKKPEKKHEENIEKGPISKPTKKTRKKRKHPIIKRIVITLLILFILGIVAAGGILAAILHRCIWGDWALQDETLNISYLNSTIYDRNGDIIGTLSGDENRQIISKDEMSPYLFKAFISIEDERFEEHNGVDWKRTLGAILSFATHKGESSYGGSTITQQVVKNLTDEKDDSGINGALRKIKEIVRAHQVEEKLSKDQILELYLNLIPLGSQMYGVETASIYYFNKSAKDLSLVESAYLAGITNAPSTYNPFGEKDRSARIKDRVSTVLWKMKQLGKIEEDEYKAAIEEVENGINFEKGTATQNNSLPYHTEEAVNQIISELMEKNSWSKEEAKLHLYGSGYKIYTTLDPQVQDAINEQFVDNSDKWTNREITVTRTNSDGSTYEETVKVEAAMAIIDYKTGQVVGVGNGLGEKESAWGKSRITYTIHNPGSSIKPLAVVGPSLEERLITAGSVVDDTPVTYGNYSPKNDSKGYRGLMNIRWILRVSRNIPEVKMMKKLTVEKSLSYLEGFGLDISNEHEDGLSLALGGMTHGPTVLQMAAAYATIANDGVYIEPTFYTKVEDSEGNIVIENEQETRRVISVQNAYILKTLLKEPVGNGKTGSSGATGPGAKVKNQDTAGKTGTTNNSTALWFCGFTPYYAAAVWRGYDIESDSKVQKISGGSGTTANLWGKVMTKAHEDLPGATFEEPNGIVTARICSKSGLLATENCDCGSENHGYAYTEYFVKGTEPKDYCDVHVKAKVCKKTNKLAGENCKDVEERVFITRENSNNNKSWEQADDAEYMLPTEKCNECKAETKPIREIMQNIINKDNTTTGGNNTTTGNTTQTETANPTDTTTQTETTKPTDTTTQAETTKPTDTTTQTETTKPTDTTTQTETTKPTDTATQTETTKPTDTTTQTETAKPTDTTTQTETAKPTDTTTQTETTKPTESEKSETTSKTEKKSGN